jgi:N,N'-diacetylbacillosaminyl-diphospho-undecaprenol alpha-1,3-N-acetylgalactosaminyltransferase
MDIAYACFMERVSLTKIALISPDGLSNIIFSRTLSKILTKKYKAKVFTISSLDLYKKQIEKIHSTHINISMARWISPVLDVIYIFKLFMILKKIKCDHIITFTTKPNIYGVIAGKLAGVKSITMAVRGLGQNFNKKNNKIVSNIVRLLYKLACKLSDTVWFTNPNNLKFFKKKGIIKKKNIIITKNGVDLSIFNSSKVSKVKMNKVRKELSIKKNSLIVVMVARLIKSKGIREYIKASNLLKKKIPNLIFLLIAPEEMGSSEFIEPNEIKFAEKNDNFKWLRFRTDVDVLYNISDLAVLPSYYQEGGYPRALIEAMAFGKPVIAADTLDCRGPVENGVNGYLVKPRDSHDLANKIFKIFKKNSNRMKLGKNSLKKVRSEFDDKKIFNFLCDEILG